MKLVKRGKCQGKPANRKAFLGSRQPCSSHGRSPVQIVSHQHFFRQLSSHSDGSYKLLQVTNALMGGERISSCVVSRSEGCSKIVITDLQWPRICIQFSFEVPFHVGLWPSHHHQHTQIQSLTQTLTWTWGLMRLSNQPFLSLNPVYL